MAEEYGVQMNIHMAESPIACMAAVHVAAATRNFMALELHSVDVPWWGDLVNPALRYDGGYITVPDTPGLGIESLPASPTARSLTATSRPTSLLFFRTLSSVLCHAHRLRRRLRPQRPT